MHACNGLNLVVVVVLFHYGLNYEYFYIDIVLKWLWVKYFQSKIFYRGNVDTIFLISFLTLPTDTQSLIIWGAAFQTLFRHLEMWLGNTEFFKYLEIF